jgi:hypothetical protein
VAFQRGIDGAEPLRPEPIGRVGGSHEERRSATRRLATGTLACPACDAPVLLGEGAVSPAAPIACPYCGHGGRVRDFLSLEAPTRPARVAVRVVVPARRSSTGAASRGARS